MLRALMYGGNDMDVVFAESNLRPGLASYVTMTQLAVPKKRPFFFDELYNGSRSRHQATRYKVSRDVHTMSRFTGNTYE